MLRGLTLALLCAAANATPVAPGSSTTERLRLQEVQDTRSPADEQARCNAKASAVNEACCTTGGFEGEGQTHFRASVFARTTTVADEMPAATVPPRAPQCRPCSLYPTPFPCSHSL